MARLIRICIRGPGGRIGVLYFFIILILGFCGIAISIRMIAWNAAFYDALQQVNGPEILRQIGIFAVLTTTSATLYLVGRYLQQVLQIRWRTVLTNEMMAQWLENQTHWKLKIAGDRADGIDNPDQRIAEDCRIFVQRFTTEGLDLINEIVSVVSFFTLLWSLSTFALSFSVFGVGIEIPRYMVWMAPIYVVLASALTHLLGAPLRQLNYTQQKREADFRFALAHIRKSSEPIALQKGEQAERRMLDHYYSGIVKNWRNLIKRELILGCFTRPYMQTVLRIPVFLALPAFIAGKLTLGGLMQMASAFTNVVTTLSWFIFSYKDLAELAATTGRLGQFLDACDQARSAGSGIDISIDAGNSTLSIRNLMLNTPDSGQILSVPDFTLEAGENVWIKGVSGIGKSTLFKALAGLWPYGTGSVRLPEGNLIFLPQQSYFPLSGLSAASVYPMPVKAFSEQEISALKQHAAIAWNQLNEHEPPQTDTNIRFSGGEVQRLSLLRIIANKPKWAFLDEPTSALDECSARQMLQSLRRLLPKTTFVIIAHNMPVGMPIHRTVELG